MLCRISGDTPVLVGQSHLRIVMSLVRRRLRDWLHSIRTLERRPVLQLDAVRSLLIQSVIRQVVRTIGHLTDQRSEPSGQLPPAQGRLAFAPAGRHIPLAIQAFSLSDRRKGAWTVS